MSFTREFPVTRAGWLLLVSGQTSAFLQLLDDGPVKIRAQATAPSLDDFTGVELDSRGLQEMALTDLDAGTNIYARSRHDETNRVGVIAPGADPGPPA